MNKDWDRFFDEPHSVRPDDEELAKLFHEVCELDTPDPGMDYWNHFNARLQEGIQTHKAPRRWWPLHGWSLKLAVSFSCSAALILLALFIPGNSDRDQYQALADLSSEQLELLESILPATEGDSLVGNIDWSENEEIDDLYDYGDDLYYDLQNVDPDALQNMLSEEG